MSLNAQSGYALRRLLPEDWPLYKSARLEALLTDPAVFGNSVATESRFPDEHWRERIENGQNAICGLFFEGKMMGLSGIFTNAADPAEARLTHSFIRPAHRGNGLAALFYKVRIDWTRANGKKRLVVSHRDGNNISKAANQRAGFTFTHVEPQLWPDGATADNVFYELDL